jgi:uncharacterized protein YcgI (DUF1989 family)
MADLPIEPADAVARRAEKPTICYRIDMMPKYDASFYNTARNDMVKILEVVVPPRDAAAFEVPAGHFFRIICVDGSQVMIYSSIQVVKY